VQFSSIKLTDYKSRWDELESHNNPFAIIKIAHLRTQATTQNQTARADWKWELTKELYERGLANKDIVKLFGIIDVMMTLTDILQAELVAKIKRLEEERKMPLISPTMQLVKEEGRQEGRQELIIQMLNYRFGEINSTIIQQIQALATEQMEELSKALFNFSSITDIEQWLQNRPKSVEQ
jgi:hypothetical protein